MTYAAFEQSTEQSQPIEFYRFIQGGTSFEYTSAQDIITIDSVDYLPEAISRSKITEGPETRKAVINLTVPATNAFALQYISSVPGQRATCTIKRVQRGDFPAPEVVTKFEGKVRSVSFVENAKEAKISLQPNISATARVIPRYTYMGMCNNVLYDTKCKVDDTDPAFRHTGIVTAISGNVITVTGASGFPDGWFVVGTVDFNLGDDFRMILDHTGDDLTLLLPFPSDITGSSVVVKAGCLHDPNACHTKFFTSEDPASNLLNYGGFWSVPTVNPFIKGLL